MIQRTELYQQYLQDMNGAMSQKAFSEDMVKSDVHDKKVDGRHYYYGIVRKEETIQAE